MRQIRYISLEPRPRSLLMQILGAIVAIAVLTVSVLVGAFVLAALFGFVLIAGAAFYLRLWWLARKARRAGGQADVIETEYTVIESRRRDSGRR